MNEDRATYTNAVHSAQFGAHCNTEHFKAAARPVVRSTVVLIHSTSQRAPVTRRTPERIATCRQPSINVTSLTRLRQSTFVQNQSLHHSRNDHLTMCMILLLFLNFPTHYLRRPSTDIVETVPHDVASVDKEVLLCRFHESASLQK